MSNFSLWCLFCSCPNKFSSQVYLYLLILVWISCFFFSITVFILLIVFGSFKVYLCRLRWNILGWLLKREIFSSYGYGRLFHSLNHVCSSCLCQCLNASLVSFLISIRVLVLSWRECKKLFSNFFFTFLSVKYFLYCVKIFAV